MFCESGQQRAEFTAEILVFGVVQKCREAGTSRSLLKNNSCVSREVHHTGEKLRQGPFTLRGSPVWFPLLPSITSGVSMALLQLLKGA